MSATPSASKKLQPNAKPTLKSGNGNQCELTETLIPNSRSLNVFRISTGRFRRQPAQSTIFIEPPFGTLPLPGSRASSANCALASSKVVTRSERVFGPLTVSDQNQRR